MAKLVTFSIDGKPCLAAAGAQLVAAATENGLYIPTLCNYPGIPPKGACRICTVRINGRLATACTSRVIADMKVDAITPELEEFRASVVEILFAEGNHLCPSCEKSGSCELQALGYRYHMTAPRFPYAFPKRGVEAWHPKILKDHNRCILCKRCIRGIHDDRGRTIFAFGKRGDRLVINIDPETSRDIGDALVKQAAEMCPVGAILQKEKGFQVPIGRRRFDHHPIGSDITESR
ncbi:MAG TPA: 2Fe-2S iron-sulfur cluster-binding protein [Spirochaetia bacterium]|nr:2Fe-2S iron-sulfur cluster-binding protein [Spirochaetia bacterium]